MGFWEDILNSSNKKFITERSERTVKKVLDKANELQEYFFKKALKEAKEQYTRTPTTVQYFYLKEMYDYLRKNNKFPADDFYDYHQEIARLEKTRKVPVPERAKLLEKYGIDITSVFLNNSGTCETLSYAAMLMSNRDVKIKDFKQYITYKYGIIDCDVHNYRGDKMDNKHTMFYRYLPSSTMKSFTDFYLGMEVPTSTTEFFDTSMDMINRHSLEKRNVKMTPTMAYLLNDNISQRETFDFLQQNTFSDGRKYTREEVDADGDPRNKVKWY